MPTTPSELDLLFRQEKAGPRPQISLEPIVTPRVLLFAAEPALTRLTLELRSSLHASVAPVGDLKLCQAALQHATFDAILVEEAILSENPSMLDDLQRWGDGALVLELNLALASPARAARQLRGALERQKEEHAHARENAVKALRSELIESVSGLLLESEIALRLAGPELESSLGRVVCLAEKLRQQLQS